MAQLQMDVKKTRTGFRETMFGLEIHKNQAIF
jgi:hypothetical protein